MANQTQYAWLITAGAEGDYDIVHHRLPAEHIHTNASMTEMFEALAHDGWAILPSPHIGKYLMTRTVESEPEHLIEETLKFLGVVSEVASL